MKHTLKRTALCATVLATFASCLFSAEKYNPSAYKTWGNANYDESKIKPYTLPDIFTAPDGRKIETPLDWENIARPQIRRIAETEFYGEVLPRPKSLTFSLLSESEVFEGKAIMRQILAKAADINGEKTFEILVFIPKAQKPKGTFVCLNYKGNHTTSTIDTINISKIWTMSAEKTNRADENPRGLAKARWPFEEIISRGYAIATTHYENFYPDDRLNDRRKDSIYAIFDKNASPHGQATVAWAWGLQRVLDYIECCPELDKTRVFAVGHSRNARAALCAAIFDERFAMCAISGAGRVGCTLSRRNIGEPLYHITHQFPHWFSPKLQTYDQKFDTMPIDQHQILALMAPRPICVLSKTKDRWADPKGELMSLVEASKVYKLFGAKKLPTMENFKVDAPFIGQVGYQYLEGVHNITPKDWKFLCDFADEYFK